MTVRTVTRAAAVLGAATALTVAGAGAAMAVSFTHEVDENEISVTIALEEDDPAIGDTCTVLLVPGASVLPLAADFAGGDIGGILEKLLANDDVVSFGPVTLNKIEIPLVDIIQPEKTITKTVDDGVYIRVGSCLGDLAATPPKTPDLSVVMVGDPLGALGSSDLGSSSNDDDDTETESEGNVLSSTLGNLGSSNDDDEA